MIEHYCGCIETEDGMFLALCEFHGFKGLINVGRKKEYRTKIVKCKDKFLLDLLNSKEVKE